MTLVYSNTNSMKLSSIAEGGVFYFEDDNSTFYTYYFNGHEITEAVPKWRQG